LTVLVSNEEQKHKEEIVPSWRRLLQNNKNKILKLNKGLFLLHLKLWVSHILGCYGLLFGMLSSSKWDVNSMRKWRCVCEVLKEHFFSSCS